LTLEADRNGALLWWIDASFAVHQDMKSHSGLTMSMGKGSIISSSTWQKINTKSSTEAQLVRVDDGMGIITWTQNFMKGQGFDVKDNIVHQDNQSAIFLERNGRASSGRCSQHINVRYFFVTDRIQQGELRVEYCPMEEMLADFFTKPLQGSLFRCLRARIMNLPYRMSGTVTAAGSQECVGTRS
jgi:hypothetical protein